MNFTPVRQKHAHKCSEKECFWCKGPIATRFEKLDNSFLSFIDLASMKDYQPPS
ncbi:hypothetical protein phytr_12140 [Candidatus Phycorickettsia trachydisci]|uniref:Uncharacterized protein n=1 Tax=Candidatus Phycorickettsia trachydisci TaxID=2115978 RepID=A0A2P1PA57_9RICK|nr:hypothetical protein phytr_12140 [Candidatus Phycorickettsia trachydisci]